MWAGIEAGDGEAACARMSDLEAPPGARLGDEPVVFGREFFAEMVRGLGEEGPPRFESLSEVGSCEQAVEAVAQLGPGRQPGFLRDVEEGLAVTADDVEIAIGGGFLVDGGDAASVERRIGGINRVMQLELIEGDWRVTVPFFLE